MTAPEPRCDSTWAIDHSLQYDGGLEPRVVETASEVAELSD